MEASLNAPLTLETAKGRASSESLRSERASVCGPSSQRRAAARSGAFERGEFEVIIAGNSNSI